MTDGAALGEVAKDLTELIAETIPALEAIGEADSLRTRGPGTWSRRQILGHVVDSALNNVHRFVRAQHGDELIFPDYDQPAWVIAAGYQDRSWRSLIRLWVELNGHVAEVVRGIPSRRLSTPCRIGGSQPMTLEFLARDYVRHLRHHLEQIFDPDASRGKTHPPFA
jgi:hypothetical protein